MGKVTKFTGSKLLGAELRRLRGGRSLKQISELSKSPPLRERISSIAAPTLSQVENGISFPSLETLHAIAQVYKRPVQQLLDLVVQERLVHGEREFSSEDEALAAYRGASAASRWTEALAASHEGERLALPSLRPGSQRQRTVVRAARPGGVMTSRRRWMTSFVGLLPAVAAVLLVTPLRAEVSFLPATNAHEARVEIRATADGPWTSRDSPTDRTLNPSGDLLGDGFPGVATRGDWAVAAWVRPGPGQVLLAIADDDGWGPTLALPADAAVGSPRTATLADGGVLLGWTEASPFDALSARIALLPPEGPSLFEVLDGPSLVLSGSELGAQAAMLALVDRQGGSFELVLASPIKPPNEPPLLRLRSLAWLDDRGGAMLDVAADTRPVIQEVTGEDDVLGVVTWWSSKGELSYVLLDRDGEPSEVRTLDRKLGHSASSRAVLGHVLKAEGLEGKR